MRELPKNPNTRPPYSDVNGEIEVHVGKLMQILVHFAERKQPPMTCDERSALNRNMLAAQRALLRARAVLDPVTMSDEDWENAKQTAHGLAVELRDREVPEEDTATGRVMRFLRA